MKATIGLRSLIKKKKENEQKSGIATDRGKSPDREDQTGYRQKEGTKTKMVQPAFRHLIV